MRNKKKRAVILRGTSGSGKSTYTKRNLPGAVICSADHFFIGADGEYRFNPRQLGIAHETCMRKFRKALRDGEDLVVVDNTNTRLREYKPYVEAAKEAGYEVEIVRLETPVDVAAARNTHGVPKDAVARMAGRMEDAPAAWREKIVSGVDPEPFSVTVD